MTNLGRGGFRRREGYDTKNARRLRCVGGFAGIFSAGLFVSGAALGEPTGNSDSPRAAAPAAVPPASPEPALIAPEPATVPLAHPQSTGVYWVSREPPPDVLPYNPNEPIPPGYELQKAIRVGYVISGSIVGGIGYGLGAIVALSDTETDFERRWLLLPFFGPFIGMATQRDTCQRGYPEQCGKSGGTIRGLAILGGMQIVGGALFAYGEFSRKPRLVLKEGYGLRIGPAALGQNGYGVAASGTW